jgi:hypothetical protein
VELVSIDTDKTEDLFYALTGETPISLFGNPPKFLSFL